MPAEVKTAMVLSAGLGTRMAPANSTLPKPLVQLCGKALIDHVLDRHVEAGIERAVVNVHYKADLIEAHLEGRRAPRIEISDERDRLLDTGGGVKRALPRLGPGVFLIHNSDSVWIEGVGLNLARLFDAWDGACMDCVMLLAVASQSLGYQGRGDFAFEADGRIRRRVEQEIVPFAFTGVSLAHPRLLDDSPEGVFSLNAVWDRAIAAGRAFGLRMEGTWMHVGTPDALAQAEQRLALARQR
ncbi:MAG TPA: nucleotidyltransferase family protein [Hyphomicrobiaceae bacterium]|jgi:MurNAc alpha-1-phosphate uridylyltransferase|nr:nucleotidyltransferase family protein [Hyphomicrobiaceae bacterium]